MKVTDPITKKSIEWVSTPDCPLWTLPVSACTNDRSLAHWFMPWENPDLTTAFQTNYTNQTFNSGIPVYNYILTNATNDFASYNPAQTDVVKVDDGSGNIAWFTGLTKTGGSQLNMRTLLNGNLPANFSTVTAKVVTNLYVAAKSWQGSTVGLWKYDSSLAFKGVYDGAQSVGGYYDLENIIYGGMHKGAACGYAAGAAKPLELICTTASGGPGVTALYNLAEGDSLITTVGNLNYEAATIGGSPYSAAYMPHYHVTADGTRVLGAAWSSADGKIHSAIFTNTSLATTGWTKQALVFADAAGGSYQIEQIDTVRSGVNTVIATVFGQLYGQARMGVAYTLNNGTNWSFLTPKAGGGFQAVAVTATTGMAETDYTTGAGGQTYWLKSGGLMVAANRALLSSDGSTLWISALVMNGVQPYYNRTGNSTHYIYKCVLTAGSESFTEYGPFFTDKAGWYAGMQMEWKNASTIRLVKTNPQTGTNPDPNYFDYPYGAPSLTVYEYDITNPNTAPVVIKSIGLDGSGSPYDIVDHVYGWAPNHEQGHGDHQVIIGYRWVRGTTGKLALNISDQRVQDQYVGYQMSRLKIVDIT